MKNLKSILLVFLFFVSNFSVVNASELLHICRITTPDQELLSSCDPFGGITYYGGSGCDREILLKVYLSNLTGYNNYPTNGPYSTPSSFPNLYIMLDSDFDGICETKIGPLGDFMWNGLEQDGADGGTHYIFEHDTNLADYLFMTNPCPTSSGDLKVKTQLMQEEPDGELILFEISDFAGSNDVVSCEVFHEACYYCQDGFGYPINPECAISLPIYEVPMCFDCTTPCRKTLHFGGNNDNQLLGESEKKSSIISKVTPNPFQDEVVVEFDIHDKSPTRLEIFDLSGALIFNKTISSEIGSRKESIDLAGLPKGIYFLKIIANNSSTAAKIVKQ